MWRKCSSNWYRLALAKIFLEQSLPITLVAQPELAGRRARAGEAERHRLGAVLLRKLAERSPLERQQMRDFSMR
jgi:hypothetical protein